MALSMKAMVSMEEEKAWAGLGQQHGQQRGQQQQSRKSRRAAEKHSLSLLFLRTFSLSHDDVAGSPESGQ